MKALTIRQPWATLIALGVKTIETRSWRAPKSLIGQTIAIHAGRHRPSGMCGDGEYGYGTPLGGWLPCTDGGPRKSERLWIEHFGAGMAPMTGRALPGDDGYALLPLGVVVATATLVECLPMYHVVQLFGGPTDALWPNVQLNGPDLATRCDGGESPLTGDMSDQLPYGNFQPGCWAWMLTDITPCDPVPAKGKQGLWEWQS